MNCPKCNFEVDSEVIFCVNCGERVAEYRESAVGLEKNDAIEENTFCGIKSKPFYLAKLPQLIGIIASIAVIILGILTMNGIFNVDVITDEGSISDGFTVSTEYSFYGGDAYTGMQQASADASNNAAVAAKNIALTNGILNDISGYSAEGFNNLQNSISGALGMLIISIGLLSAVYYTINLIKKED